MLIILYHFSEEAVIETFIPRPNKSYPHLEPAVWAIDHEHAAHYYFPRDCPRVIYWKSETSTDEDINLYFKHSSTNKIIVIENRWIERLRDTRLYVYGFEPKDFYIFEGAKTAGYYISHKEVKPLQVEVMDNLLERILEQEIELRFTPKLGLIRNSIIQSTLDFSIIRYSNAIN
jgi:hypothetical protein